MLHLLLLFPQMFQLS